MKRNNQTYFHIYNIIRILIYRQFLPIYALTILPLFVIGKARFRPLYFLDLNITHLPTWLCPILPFLQLFHSHHVPFKNDKMLFPLYMFHCNVWHNALTAMTMLFNLGNIYEKHMGALISYRTC